MGFKKQIVEDAVNNGYDSSPFDEDDDETGFSQCVVNDDDDSSPLDKNEDETYFLHRRVFEIDFYQELSNGSLVFKIIDDNHRQAGHVVVSSSGAITIIENRKLYQFDDNDNDYLENQANKFYHATR